MPNSKKKTWDKPTVTQFDSYEDARAYYMSRAKPEEIAAVDRIFKKFHGMQAIHQAEHEMRRLRRWAS